MAREFSVMKTNVGEEVGDTSAPFLVKVGKYLNKRYFSILRAMNWQYINEDYTLTMEAGTQDYALPSDFGTEMYAVDITNNTNLTYVELQTLAQTYPGDLTTGGEVRRYTIFASDDESKYFRAHYVPVIGATIAFPYIVKPVPLTDGASTILNLEDLVEQGATADAWRKKREFMKARDIEVLFNQSVSQYIWEYTNKQNKVYQFKPRVFNRDDLV